MTLAMDTKLCTRYNVQAIADRLEMTANSVWGWFRNNKKPKNAMALRLFKEALRDPAMRAKPKKAKSKPKAKTKAKAR